MKPRTILTVCKGLLEMYVILREIKQEQFERALEELRIQEAVGVKPDEGRLLTKEEMMALNNAMPSEAKYGDVFESIVKSQDVKTSQHHEARMREMFKEIEKYRANVSDRNLHFIFSPEEYQALKAKKE